MRIGLITEGTYPVVKGGVSTWCDQLITGLDEHEWQVVALVGQERGTCWPAPPNLVGTTLVPMWDPPPGVPLLRFGVGRQRRKVADALHRLWRSVLPGAPAPAGPVMDDVQKALLTLAAPGPVSLARLLSDEGSTEPLLAAWAAHRAANPSLPELTVAQAARVATFCDRMLMVLEAQWPEVDVVNASSNGAAALVALARHWRDGVPVVLTEHGVYLRERYLALQSIGWEWVTRYAAMAFTRAICQLAYAEAALIAPVSRFNGRWEGRLGADPAKVVPIPNGVDPLQFPAVEGEPAAPVVSFVGRIDPLKDLHTMIEAFALVRREIPDARLRLFGPTPPVNAEYRAGLEASIGRLGLDGAVIFEGPAPSARPAIEAGQVVALSSISEGLPFTVIEAMMSGRPTVNTDVGGVGEVTGPSGEAAFLVPPRDARAFADALIALLQDPARRAAMGRAARERMLDNFSLPVFEQRYRTLYELAAAGGYRLDQVRSLPRRAVAPAPVDRMLMDGERLPRVGSSPSASPRRGSPVSA